MDHSTLNFTPGHAGWLAPGRWLPLRTITWALILYAIAHAFLAVSVFGARWLGMPNGVAYGMGIGLPIFGFVFYALVVEVGEHRIPGETAFGLSSCTDMVVGFALGAVIIALMLLLLDGLGLYSVHAGHWQGVFDSFVFDSYIPAMLEELAFRAVLLRLLARIFRPVAALLLSSALFGLAHLPHATVLQAVEVSFNAGLIMGMAYMLTGQLWMSVGIHMGWNFTEASLLGVNAANGLLASVPNPYEPAFLTGGAYGPEGSLLAAIVGCVAVAAMRYANRCGWFGTSRRQRGMTHPRH